MKKILPRNILAGIYLVLTVFHYHIEKYINGWVYGIIFFTIVFLFLALIYNITRNIYLFFKYKATNRKFILEAAIYCVILLNSLTYPSIVSSRIFEPAIVKRGCYEGTMNTCTMYLRSDGSFDMHQTGFGSVWYSGKWSERGDTLLLSYRRNKPERIATKYHFTNGTWNAIKAENDSQNYIYFYEGYCKGLN
jgi:hypothetical protein